MTLYERALRVTPGGAQTNSKAPGRVGPIGGFPLYATGGAGPILVAQDDRGVDREYLDWFNGNCAVTLGHGHGGIAEAVARALRSGPLPSLPSRLEVEVAEQLVEALEWPDQVRFVKTGSEACAGAVRLARMATGRDVVVTIPSGYHGWHDWFAAAKPAHPGVPDCYESVIAPFRYNDTRSLESALQAHRGRVAAVMLEPTLTDPPTVDFLSDVRALADVHGALLIFDEMICGNRWAVGGGGQYYGVTPDLATFGKAFANGLPLAFIAGRRELMQHAWVVSGTFGGETASLAACQVVLDTYRREPVIGHLWTAGEALRDAVNSACHRVGLPATMGAAGCRPVLRWAVAEPLRGQLVSAFQEELAAVGVLAHPSGWNPSYAHTPSVVSDTCDRVERALRAVAERLGAGDLAPRGGVPMRQAPVRATS